MKQLFFIHGGSAYTNYQAFLEDLKNEPVRDLPNTEPVKKWSSTLREELEGYEVFTPSMPNSKNAKYIEWKIWFERYLPHLRDGVMLVGWSQGGYFLTKYMIEETLPVTVEALFLIAAPFQPADFDGEDGGDFAFDTTKVSVLVEKTNNIYLLHSKDDFVVPYQHALQYQASLPTAKLVTFEDKNHFLIPEFPELMEIIRSVS